MKKRTFGGEAPLHPKKRLAERNNPAANADESSSDQGFFLNETTGEEPQTNAPPSTVAAVKQREEDEVNNNTGSDIDEENDDESNNTDSDDDAHTDIEEVDGFNAMDTDIEYVLLNLSHQREYQHEQHQQRDQTAPLSDIARLLLTKQAPHGYESIRDRMQQETPNQDALNDMIVAISVHAQETRLGASLLKLDLWDKHLAALDAHNKYSIVEYVLSKTKCTQDIAAALAQTTNMNRTETIARLACREMEREFVW
jgi:hypothetical protein